jgi:hypothetical protein
MFSPSLRLGVSIFIIHSLLLAVAIFGFFIKDLIYF